MLVARVLNGDTEAFATVVARHQRVIQAIGWRLLRDHDRADDATQATFVLAYQRLAQWRGQASLRAWLCGIALNQCRAQLRDARRHVPLDDVGEPVASAPAGVLRRTLAQLVGRLPPRQRAVLVLRIDGDLPFREIARMQGITENAAKVSYHHAVQRLRAWLQGTG